MIDKDFFVVTGASKSGTTWLQKLIHSHPDAYCEFQYPTIPPKNYFDKKITPVFNSKKSPFKGVFSSKSEEESYWLKRSFLREFHKAMRKLSFRLSEMNDPRLSENPDFKSKVDDIFLSFTNNFISSKKQPVVGYKAYTDPEYLFKLKSNAKLICIYRDYRDVCVSKRFHTIKYGIFFNGDENFFLLKFLNKFKFFKKIIHFLNKKFHLLNENSFNPYKKKSTILKFPKIFLTKVANEWNLINKDIIKIKKKYPKNVFIVNYRDLKENNELVINRIFNFLKLNSSEDIINHVINQNSFKKKQISKDSFYRKGIYGDWKNHLDRNQISYLNYLCEETFNELERIKHV